MCLHRRSTEGNTIRKSQGVIQNIRGTPLPPGPPSVDIHGSECVTMILLGVWYSRCEWLSFQGLLKCYNVTHIHLSRCQYLTVILMLILFTSPYLTDSLRYTGSGIQLVSNWYLLQCILGVSANALEVLYYLLCLRAILSPPESM